MKSLFELYKEAKNILLHGIEYESSLFDFDEFEDKIQVWSVNDTREIAFLDYANQKKPVIAINGILAFNHTTRCLIINTDVLDSNLLDESSVECLFIGKDVKKITDRTFLKPLRYLYVDSRNPFFKSEDNCLYTNDFKELIYYSCRPEEEYHVNEKTKVIKSFCFRNPGNLKKLYISKSTQFEGNNLPENIEIINE